MAEKKDEKKDEKKATNQKAGPFLSPTPEEKLVRETDRLKGERAQAERMEKNTAQEGEPLSKAPAPEEAPAENTEQDAGEPVPPAGSHKIQIIGEGGLSLMVDGKPESLERGSSIKASPALIEALEAGGIAFKKVKS